MTGSFFEGWLGGEPSEAKMRTNLGGALDGVLCEYRVWPAAALVRTPDHLSDVEAASLPCAGLTAWSAVVKLGNIRPGQTVLTQGTGGVSIFALQFAKMNGARVIATSSSEAKIEKLKGSAPTSPSTTRRRRNGASWRGRRPATASTSSSKSAAPVR